MRKAIALAALMVLGASVWAQVHVIQDVDYQIEGRTQEYQLALRADINAGTEFADRAALDAYVADKVQVLRNERVLESADIDVAVGEPLPDGRVPVVLTVRTVDTWNIVALPYFRYDSNLGLLLSIRGRDYDFLGSMETLRVNLNRDQDLDGNASWGMDADFSYPFPAWGLDWVWSLGGAFSIPEDGDPAAASLETSLGLSKPLGPGTLEATLGQVAYFNRQDSSGGYYDDAFYLRSSAELAWRLSVDIPATELDLSVRPKASVGVNWLPGGFEDAALDSGPLLTAGLGASWGRADWNGNFRAGLTLSADAAYNLYAVSGDFSRVFGVDAAWYGAYGWVGPSARLVGRWTPDGPSDALGAETRGVLNSRMSTDLGVVLNLDLPVRVLRFVPYEWFGKGWMRYFQFEQHWSPFLDLALGHYDDEWFNPASGWYGAGLEVVTYPLAMRSFYVRISLGVSVPDVLATRSLSAPSPRDGHGAYELFIGFGNHY